MTKSTHKNQSRQRKQDSQVKTDSALANHFWQTLGRIFTDLITKHWSIVLVFFTSIGSVIFNVVGPRQLGQATTYLFEGAVAQLQGTGSIDLVLIGRQLLFVLSLYLFSAAFGGVQAWLTSTITQAYIYDLRQELVDKINRLPMSYFEARTHGEVLSQLTLDVDTLGNGLTQAIITIIDTILTTLGVIGMMFAMNVSMTWMTLTVIPVSLLLVFFLTKYSQEYFQSQQAELSTLHGIVEESYAGQSIIQAFNQEAETEDDFYHKNEALYESAWRSQFYSGTLYPSMNFVAHLSYIAVAIAGVYYALQGVISVGDIQAFSQYVNRFTLPITQLAQTFTQLQSMVAAGERVYHFLDEEEESQTQGQPLELQEISGHISFDQVQFGYLPGQSIIQNFTSKISAGQKVALVGPTGAGKSTMVKLLMRFYEVNQGEISLDGRNISDYSRSAYRQAMGMVLQETWLFHGSILDNIRYGCLEASDEEVYAAARAARADQFIHTLPGGYEFVINEALTNLSQGQKQLLTIARAILADRPVLILDEATSSIDTRTEILIQEAMDELMQGRTSFVIAHRLSTIRDADQILYMENGDILEQGSHEELMDMDQGYARLYRSQFSTN